MKEPLVCSVCGAGLTKETANEFEGQIMCASCLESETTLCDCCGERISYSSNHGNDAITLIMPKKATTTVVLKAPKTESSKRNVYLPRAVVEELLKMKETQKQNKALLANEYHEYNLVVAKVNGMPYELRTIDKMFYKFIEKKSLRPVVFHSLRHSSTSLKLKLSKGNIKAVQGDTGHAEARMVTDTYAHSFDEDRKLIAQEMDSGFFNKVEEVAETSPLDDASIEKLKTLIKQHPELLNELLNTN